MTAREMVAAGLVGLGVAIELLCCVGILVMRNTFARLHYLGPATTVGPLAIAAGVLTVSSSAANDIKVILIALTLFISGPILTHATARAARVRRIGSVSGAAHSQRRAS
jgi:multicomponent Na+:H+ antiporter subunit G